jgi:hypothetical protein
MPVVSSWAVFVSLWRYILGLKSKSRQLGWQAPLKLLIQLSFTATDKWL